MFNKKPTFKLSAKGFKNIDKLVEETGCKEEELIIIGLSIVRDYLEKKKVGDKLSYVNEEKKKYRFLDIGL